MAKASPGDRANGSLEVAPAGARLRWMCPYCGESERNKPVTEAAKDDAMRALRAHLESTRGDGHGPPGELPDDDALALAHHVIVADTA